MSYNEQEWKAVESQFAVYNDYVFGSVMSHPEICTPFLQMVLPEVKFDKPVTVSKQVTAVVDSEGKSIRLDIKAVDAYGQLYDIEMQNVHHKEDLEPRIRYYGSLMDCDTIDKGEEYRELPNVFIIFVCNFDFKGLNQSIYDFAMRDRYNPSTELHDGRRVILINCLNPYNFPNDSYKRLSEFVKYVRTNIPTDDFTKLVHHYVQESKKKPAEREAFMEYFSLDHKIAQQQEYIQMLQSKYAKLESRNTMLESRSTMLESRNATLEGRSTMLESRNAALESRSTMLESRNSELEEEVRMLKEQLAKRN